MTHRRAVWILVGCTVIWGAGFPLNKMALNYTSPLLFMALRFACAGVLLAPVYRRATRSDWQVGLALGTLFAAQLAFFFVGLSLIEPGRTAFVFSLQTPLVPALVLLAHRKPPTPRDILLVATAMLGVWLLTRPGAGAAGFGTGDLATLASAVLAAVYVVLAGHLAPRHEPLPLLAVQLTAIAGLALAGALLVEHPRIELNPVTLSVIPFLGLASVASFGGQLLGQRMVRATEAALIYALEPVVAALASFVALGEVFTGGQAVGAALILAASMVAARKPR